jgi:hypothetical protein
MKINPGLPFFTLIIALFFSCSNKTSAEKDATDTHDSAQPSASRLNKNYLTDCRKLYSEARKMDSVLLQQTEADQVSANKAIQVFTDFAYYCGSDSMSPIYLIKTAQVAKAINNIPQAKIALDKCIDTYLSFKGRPAALFLLAQLYDERTYLNNEDEAKRLYQEIIDEYPKSDWAINAKGAIRFLGKTDEEMLKEFKKRSK